MEIDVTDWAVIRPETGGADQDKDWLAREPGAERVEQWLWKPRQRTGDGSEEELSDVSEVLASQIARHIELPVAECLYATRAGVLGVLSKNVSPARCDLEVGQIYLESVIGYERISPTYDSQGRQRGVANLDRGYTLEAVAEVLDGVIGPPGWHDLTGMQVFSGYLVLDALIANTDRHPRNWALLEPWEEEPTMLAPAYDHGRALGAGLTERNRRERDPRVFCKKGLARPFTPSESLVELALRAVREHDGRLWVDRLAKVPRSAFDRLVDSSSHRMSAAASTFIGGVLIENQRRLCDDDND